ncbi:PssE/Cps14G family polysaccharide biosynthesis glycosyltransferase [Alkalihalobacillus sp. CinArs1]|uniref:PssE/Cps14G family polysaccharide biosynthesis glycosyltransferase n=1 Tax=Alkalihalobacillus sp. CinArs1 TaxID=2995314 RepID=UPI0022DE2134|nr:PssE/Cps14G family polysaccharide biosynthesis glycosyltransferase [Alkalihalobacillus sp. CinArs1]
MIFVTVGTHEQPFDRLVSEIDDLIEKGMINEEVFVQIGYTTYKPKHFEYEPLISYDQMIEKAQQASIIITHGGPGSIMLPLSMGKTPIVVPRQAQFAEHVDDHQVYFAKRLEQENRIVTVLDISTLKDAIQSLEGRDSEFVRVSENSNLDYFIGRLDEIAVGLIED